MNVVAVTCDRDEIDTTMEAFVRHNLAFVSRLIVLDNGSTDGTRDVLHALQRNFQLTVSVPPVLWSTI